MLQVLERALATQNAVLRERNKLQVQILLYPVLHFQQRFRGEQTRIADIHVRRNREQAALHACLHFPHIILSGERLVIWESGGQLPASFFYDLERDTGWARTVYLDKHPVLVSPRKVHLFVEYSRNRPDGTVITSHKNLRVVTYDEDRWGIKQRSY